MATNPFGFGPRGLPAKEPASPESIKASIDDLAVKTQIPANILIAFAERGYDPAVKAKEISGWINGGRKVEEVVPPDVMNRAYDIADALYPREAAPTPAKAEKPSALMDMGKQFGGSLVRGIGGMVDAAGAAADTLITRGNLPEEGYETPIRSAARDAGKAVSGVGDRIQSGVSDESKKALAGSSIGGDLFDPSTWTLGESPSLRGYAMLASDVLGSFLPVVATAVITKSPTAAATVGGLQGGGAATQTARKTIEDMAAAGVLAKESAYFRELVASGMPEAQAIETTARAAEQAAFLLTTPISAFGGAATGKILNPGISALAGKGLATRVAGTAAASALEEGTQEVAESIATKAGINKGAGTDLSLTEGTFADFILGAMGGGPVGAVSGAFNKETRDDGSVAGQAGAPASIPPGGMGAPVTNTSGVAAPGAEGGAAVGQLPTPPAGPLRQIADSAPDLTPVEPPAPRFPDFKPGKDVALVDPETGVIHNAVFIAETPNGVAVRIDGGEVELDPQTFDQARVAAIKAAEGEKPKKKGGKNAATAADAPADLSPVPPEKPYESGFDAPAQAIVDMGGVGIPETPPGPVRAADTPAMTPDEALKRAKIIEDTAKRGGWNARLKKKHAEFMAIAGGANAQGQETADDVGAGNPGDGGKLPDLREGGQGTQEVVRDGRPATNASGQSVQPDMVSDGDAAGGSPAVAGAVYGDDARNDITLTLREIMDSALADGERGNIAGASVSRIVFEFLKAGSDAFLDGKASAPRVPSRKGQILADFGFNKAKQQVEALGYKPVEAKPKVAPITTPPDARIQPDMLGGAATTETEMAAKERRRKEWGRFLGIVENGKSMDDSTLEGRDVLIRGTRVIIRAKLGAPSDLDMRLDTGGMDRDTIATQIRGALSELDRRAPLPVPDQTQAPIAQQTGITGQTPAPDAPPTQQALETDQVVLKDSGKGRLGRVSVSRHADGWYATYDYDVPGFAGGSGSAQGGPFPTKEAAISAGKATVARKVEDIADGRAGSSATAAHVAKAERILKWARDDKASEAGAQGKPDAGSAVASPQPGEVPASIAPAPTGLLSVLSPEKQARAAELAKKLADKARNQTSSGLDPEYITLGGELVKLYLEAGVKKFGQILKDFASQTGLTLKQAQEPMRAAYNHVRDNMEIEGESIDGMDDARAVLDEAKKAIQGDAPPPPAPKPRDPVSANPNPTGQTYRLENALTTAERRIIATARDQGAYVGEVFAELDNASRRAEADMRSRGVDIAQADDIGNINGKPDQMAWFIREAEAHAKELVKQVKAEGAENVGPLDKDEDTGEWEYDGSALGNALEFLDQQYAMGLGVDEDVIPGPGGGNATAMNPEKVFPAPKGTRNIDSLVEQDGFIRKVEADARLAFWKKTAARLGKDGKNADKVILSLFDYKGTWSQPWVDAGYTVIRHDIKTGSDLLRDQWIYDRITEIREGGKEVYGVLSACPCTTFTGSGARWWQERHDVESREALAQVFGDMAVTSGAKSALEYNIMLADATREAVRLANPTGFHVLENPIGRIQDKAKFPAPLARFHPHNFGDPYTKRTQLFGDFQADLPTANVQPVEGSKMQNSLRGSDPLGKEDRSTTPEGFAYAFFMANDPEARKVKDNTGTISGAVDRLSGDAVKGGDETSPPLSVEPAPVPQSAPWWDTADDLTRRAILKEAGLFQGADVADRFSAMSEGLRGKLTDAFGRLYRAKKIDNIGTTEAPRFALAGETIDATAVPTAAEVKAVAAETDPNPTPAQAEAENYKTGKIDWHGLTLSIENAKDSIRRKVTPDGKTEWEVKMPAHYGRILGTTGADGDHVDFYMGPAPDAEIAYVIDQRDAKTGEFDEHKVMLGFKNQKAAKDAYLAGFSDGKGPLRLMSMTPMGYADLVMNLKQNPEIWKGPISATNATLPPKAAKPKASKADGGADRPMDLAALRKLDWDAWDDKTREDGQGSPAKRAGRDETGRWARALVKVLKDNGFTPDTMKVGRGEKEKAYKEVDFGYGMSSEFDETNVHLKAPNGLHFYLKIGNSWNRDGLFNLLVQFTGEPPKPGYSRPFIGGNAYLREDMTPQQAAQEIILMAERRGGAQTKSAAPTAQDINKAMLDAAKASGRLEIIDTRPKAAPEIDGSAFEAVGMVRGNGASSDSWFRKQRETGGIASYKVRSVASGWKVTRDFTPDTVTAPPTRELGTFSTPAEAIAQLKENGMRTGVPEEPAAPAKTSSEKTWKDFDESSATDPKMPAGYELTAIRRLTRDEARSEGYQWPAMKAVVKRDRPYTYKVESAISEKSRSDAVAQALRQAQKGAVDPASVSVEAPTADQDTSLAAWDNISRDLPDGYTVEVDSVDVFGFRTPKGQYIPWGRTFNKAQDPQAHARDVDRMLGEIDRRDRQKVDRDFDQGPGEVDLKAFAKMGADAFAAGGPRRTPIDLLDRTPQAALVGDLRTKAYNKAGKAYLSGWDRANLDAPMADSPVSAQAPTAVDGDVLPPIDTMGQTLTPEAQRLVDKMVGVWIKIADAQMSGEVGSSLGMGSATIDGMRALESLVGEDLAAHIDEQLGEIYNSRKAQIKKAKGAVEISSEKPATLPSPPAKGKPNEQLGDQGSDQGFMDFSQSGGENDAAGSGETGLEGDGRGEGDQNAAGSIAGDEPAGGVERDTGRVSDSPAESRVGDAPPNFTITDTFALGEGTDGQKLEGNLAALRLVKALEAENRYATPEEQATLARWVGWGGLKTVFDEKHKGTTSQWGRAQAELKAILTRTEYFDAMRSTADAHYTSRVVVDAMWQAMRNFGFTGGRALEPTIGSGNFLGLQPADMSLKTEWFASEIDSMTGRVVKHLYPRATVFDGMGFQDAPFRRATFDIAIGNPPFGGDSSRVGNAKMHPDMGRMKVHNFVIAKTGQLLREGGIMGMVVTHRFLDAMDAEARDVLAPNFHFLGAIRLPNTAFKANAGTEVTTDIVFFQKRRAGDEAGDTSWLDVDAKGPNGTTMNAWFANNPDMILGRPAMDGTMYAGGRRGEGEFTVHDDGRDLAAALAQAVGKIKASLPDLEQALEDAVTAPKTVSTLGYGEMMLAADNRIFRGDVAEDGSAKVEEITAETFWRDNAAAQFDLVAALEPFAKPGARDLGIEATQRARNAAVAVGLMDLAGDPVQVSTKFEQELADAIPALLFGSASKAQREAYTAYAKRVEAKRLGTDGFERLKGILDLRGRVMSLIRAERNDYPPMEQIRGGLRQAYQQFRAKFGFLNNSKNEAILQGDVGPEMALEIKYKPANKDGRAETAEEAPILTKRVIFPHRLPERVDSIEDGIHVSMQERGYVDPNLIADLTDKTGAEIIETLTGGEAPLAFKNPATSRFEPAEIYLSGNIAEKIERAKTARAFDHIPHLKAAMPPPKTQEQVTASIRSMWIPRDVFEDFLRTLGYRKASVSIMEKVGMVAVDFDGDAETEFGQQFKTDRASPGQIFEAALKGKIPVIYDTIRENGSEKRVKNEEATKEAVAAYERMTAEFPNWAYANPMRAAKIVDAFNEKVNVVTPRKYDGVRYLRTVGTSPLVQLRNSQKNGAWRMIQDKMVLEHHVVGAGKTMTGITGVMERKRMGLTRKAVIVVPNHLTGQWGKEWLELYPAANILVPTEKDFDPANRAKLINRIATGDFDAVIIGHSQLVKIDNDPEIVTTYVEEEMDALNDAMQEQKRSGESKRTVAQMGQKIQKLREKLDRLNDNIAERRGAGLLSWKELGVDYMVLDESQEFKNLEYATSATQLVGMNDPNGSQKAFDLLMKIRGLQSMQNGGVTFMTGTPISNSLVEIYSVMKYLIPESLDAMGIKHFDAWKAAFIQDESRFEYTASMQLKERNVMSGMVNLGPLAELYRSFADIVMRPDVERMYREQMEAQNAANPDKPVSTRFPTPKVQGGKRRIMLAPPTGRMEEFTRYLVTRMAGIKNAPDKKKYAKTDNPLWVLTDARKASVDIRTIDPSIGREEGSKVTRSAAEIFRIWEANAEKRGAQMVFSDMSTPSKNAEKDAKAILKAAYGKIGLKKDALARRMAKDEGRTYSARWADLVGDIETLISSPETSDAARDALNIWANSPEVQDAAGAMLTADTGFSFYDDLRTMLVEKGIPEGEIAFIHDYGTTAKKKDLFDAVNEGKVRVLIGSTMKMGAGTNAQRRLVALHHIDAPWRPSDMEQREGRIIRQGNLFYEQDPDGFEVEIIAYSTEKTADVVQWQVLERKAKAIETFLGAAADSIQEEGGDTDQYAEFMAQSTGKKVFLQKMQVEKDLIKARGAISSALRSRAEAGRFIENYDAEQEYFRSRSTAYGGVTSEIFPAGASDYLAGYRGDVEAYRAERDRIEAENDQIRIRNVGKPRKEWEKLLDNPNAPKRWTTRPTNEWEAKVYDALQRGHDRPTAGPQVIRLSADYSIEIHTHAPGEGMVNYSVYLVPAGINNGEIMLNEGLSVSTKDFRNSEKLLSAFDPSNIMFRAEDRSKTAARRMADHAAMLPKMRDVMEKVVNESVVKDLQVKLAALSAETRIEEVKYAEESAKLGANHFVEMDDKGRDLRGDDSTKALKGQFQFVNAGRNYASEWGAPAGRRRIAGTEKWGEVAYFEAEDLESGDQVIVEATKAPKEEGETEGRWTVQNVFDRAADGSMEMRDAPAGWGEVAADPKITEADIMSITRDLNAELGRTGLSGKVNVRVVRELYSRVSGSPIMGRADSTGITVKAGTQVGDIGVMRHEIIHALRSEALWNRKGGLFTEAEWSALAAAARAEPEIVASIKERYPHLDKPAQVEEMIAELYRLWMDNRDGYSGIERALLKVEGFLTALANLLRGRGFVSAARVMEQIATGKIGGRGPQGPGGGRGIRSGLKKSHTEMRGGAVRYDNPGGSWLAGKVERAEEAMRKAPKWSAAYRGITGPATAYTTAPVSLPVDFVAGLPGASGEKRGPGDPQYDALADAVRREGWRGDDSPILIEVNHKGQAFITEGNTRAAIAQANGVQTIKAEVKWLNGGEAAQGALTPARLESMVGGAEMRGGALPGAIRSKFKGLIGSRQWKNPGEFVSNTLTDAMAGKGDYSALALVPGRALFAELGKRLPSAKVYLRAKEEMDSLRNDWHAKADEVAQQWRKARRADPRANDDLMDLMHRSTLSGVDPSRPDTWKHAMGAAANEAISRHGESAPKWAFDVIGQIAAHEQAYATLQERFNALPKEMQEIYRKTRAAYDKMGDDFERAVLDNIKASMAVAVKRAEKAHRKEMDRIRDEGLKGPEKDAAIKEADEKLAAVKKRGGWAAQAKVNALRKKFESNRLKGPYFPLARFGQYFVTIRNHKGEVVSFSRFEKEAQQQTFIREQQQAGAKSIQHGVLSDSAAMKAQIDPTFVADIEMMLADSGASNDVMDAIWQRYLETLPDQSIRTSKIHRKGREGWNKDASRAFGHHMFHGSHQLARLKYGLQLEEALNDAEDEAKVAEDPNRAGLIVNEMRKRHAFIMNPTGSSLVAGLSSLSFVWYLGATPAAAVANISQTTVVGPGIMAARFKDAGVTGALREIGRALKDFGAGRGDTMKSPRITQDEHAALAEAYRRGTIDKTQAHDLASVAETGIEYNATREAFMRKIGWMFHHAERMNREVTFLANYRLARADGLRGEEAVDLAADLTWKIHFDYQNTSRPRFMQNDLGKLLTIFRQFTVNLAWRVFRDTHQMLRGATKEERAEARTQLVGLMLSMMAHAGIKGTYGYGLLMGLLAIFFPGDSDDIEEWLQDALLMEGDNIGVSAWNYTMGAALNGVPGQIIGADLTERIGSPNIWFRGPSSDLEGADLFNHYLTEFAGPPAGIVAGWFIGGQRILDGDFYRGAEAAMPKMVRDILKTGRYAAEGVETMKGDDILENVNPWELLLQANGFTPARVAERFDINTRLKNKEAEIMDERKGIHKGAVDAILSGEPIPADVMDEIRDFNRRFPEYPITSDTIRQSAQGRMRAQKNADHGITLNPRISDRLREDLAPAIYE